MIKEWVDHFKTWSWGTIGLLSLLVLIGGGGGFAITLYYLKQPPVVVYNDYEDDGVVVQGGDLEFLVAKKDNQVCRTSVARWLWRPDPTDPLPDTDPQKRRQYRAVTSTPYGPPAVGKITSYRLSVPLPPHIEEGDWHPLNVAIDVCGGAFSASPRFTNGKVIHIDRADQPMSDTAAPPEMK